MTARRIRKNEEKYLPPALVAEGEAGGPEARERIVRTYLTEHPRLFTGERATVERILREAPIAEGRTDLDALRTELLFGRIAYGFHPEEYLTYELEGKTPQERQAFIPARECLRDAYRMNDMTDMDVFNNKGMTYRRFGRYYRREAVYLSGEMDLATFLTFTKAHPVFVKKMVKEAMGRSVELVDLNETGQAPEDYFRSLLRDGPHILEERVVQSETLARLNPSSVNTIRSITFLTRHGIEDPYYFMKIGRAGSFVDNGGAGGILVGIDRETGRLCTDGYDEFNRRYETHPDSGVTFRGYQLPDWDAMKTLCREMSAQIPSVKLIGWDMAHTDGGWVVIEGNGKTQFIGPQTVFKRGIRTDVEGFLADMDLIV